MDFAVIDAFVQFVALAAKQSNAPAIAITNKINTPIKTPFVKKIFITL